MTDTQRANFHVVIRTLQDEILWLRKSGGDDAKIEKLTALVDGLRDQLVPPGMFRLPIPKGV
jgi:hypothetical protein